ncbi:hypothetical protein [Paucibacter sp. B51]|uniref:hypothetical protein n=1 Tax=Paucibacter sp. B51 TaxID=2993315 RepID=UPI0022EBD9AC|nr:hypothetical protein [Paucibacter sp. B51]
MTPTQRSSISNGIWLCNNCSRLIDNDPASFPAELLHRWKAQAETLAASRHGRRHLRPKDVQDQMKMVLGALPPSVQDGAIANVHRASKAALESLDRRFSVETSFVRGESLYTLNALETVPFRFKVPAHRAPEWREQLRGLLDHGRRVKVNTKDVKIEGSDLMAHLFDGVEQGTLEIAPHGVEAAVRVSLRDAATGKDRELEPFAGRAYAGVKTFSVDAQSLGGLLRLGCEHDLAASASDNLNLSFELCTDVWEGGDIRFLPNFQAAYDLFAALAAGAAVDLELFARGLKVCRASYAPQAAADHVRDAYNRLGYLRRARRVADFLNRSIKYKADLRFTAEQHVALAEAADIIEGAHEGKLTSDVEATLTLTADDPEVLSSKVVGELLFVGSDPGPQIDVYGEVVQMPAIEIRVTNVVARPPKKIKRGATIKVTWKPTPQARCTYRYQSLGVPHN